MLSFQEAHFQSPAIARFDAEFFPHVDPEAFAEEVAANQAAFWADHGVYNGDDDDDYDDDGGSFPPEMDLDYYFGGDSDDCEVSDDYEVSDDNEDDDGLGYYPDGVKRTLTDEQVAIFRHSELERLRRAKEAEEAKEEAKASRKRTAAEALSPAADTAAPAPAPAAENGEIPDDLSEEGEIEGPAPKKRKKNRRKKARTRADGVVIDLRKRTWDVVETGLGSLDYEEEGGADMPGALLKRRKVSYDD